MMQLALIPLADLPQGEFKVTLSQLPDGWEAPDGKHSETTANDAPNAMSLQSGDRFVCHGFSFTVEDSGRR